MAMELLSIGRALSRDEPERALAALHEALDLAVSVRGSLLSQPARRAIIQIDTREGGHPKALAVLRDVLDNFEQSGDRSQQLQTVLAGRSAILDGELVT